MILLASQSPQRRMLLERAGLDFTIIPTVEDDADIPGPAQAIAVERARQKALGADFSGHEDALAAGTACILAADTVAILGRELIGKPTDRADAVRILMSLQGTRHTVCTAHCAYIPGENPLEAVAVAMTQVTMFPMSPEEVQKYVDSGEADGKAGAYAIQETADQFIEEMNGDTDTVIGLNLAAAQRLVDQVLSSVSKG